MRPDNVAWTSPIRTHIVERAREARAGDPTWQGDVATLGLASFLRALDVQAEVDAHDHGCGCSA